MLKSVNHSLGLALLGGSLAIASAIPAHAQVVVTGGNASFQGTQIFVPDVNSRLGTVVYNGSARTLIRTSQGPIDVNLLVNNGILPTLNTSPEAVPKIGDTGRWLPTVNFVGLSAAGEPTFFLNIPADISFKIDSITPTGAATDINRYQSVPVLLTQTGVGVNASSFGGVQRTTPVVFVGFGTSVPSNLSGLPIDRVTPGVNYPGDFTAGITGGTVSVPLTASFGTFSNPTLDQNKIAKINSGSDGSLFFSASTSITSFGSSSYTTTMVAVSSIYENIVPFGNDGGGGTPDKPGDATKQGESKQGESNKNDDDDDDDADFVDNNNDRYIVIGVPSRVFPGLVGIEKIKRKSTKQASLPTTAPVQVSVNAEPTPVE
jgi:hypothetical protein